MLEITFENGVVEFWLPKLLTFQKKTPSYRISEDLEILQTLIV